MGLLRKSKSMRGKVRGIILEKETGNGRSLRKVTVMEGNRIHHRIDILRASRVVYSISEVFYNISKGVYGEGDKEF